MIRPPTTVRRPMAVKQAEHAPHPMRALLATWRWPLLTLLAVSGVVCLMALAIR